MAGISGTGRSVVVDLPAIQDKTNSAEVAANATTARNASAVTVGKSARISSADAPSARLASNVLTVTRVPRRKSHDAALNTGGGRTSCGTKYLQSCPPATPDFRQVDSITAASVFNTSELARHCPHYQSPK